MPDYEVNPADVPVVILCGGQGTRIRDVSDKIPKPLIPIGNQPILWHIMKIYSAHGFRKFILCLGFKAWDIKEFFLSYQSMISDISISTAKGDVELVDDFKLDDWEVSLIDTGLHSGTGGRLAKVSHLIDNDYFMLSYGDGIGDVDLSFELEELVKSDKIGLVTGVHPTSRYGELVVDGNDVTSFAEKPQSNSWVSGGFFAFRKEFLDYLPKNDPDHFFEHQPTQKLAKRNKLGLFEHSGFWMGMDTFREYTALNEMWDKDEAPWKNWD